MWDDKSKLLCLECRKKNKSIKTTDKIKNLPTLGGHMNGFMMDNTCPVDTFLSVIYYHMYTYDKNFYK